VERLLSRVRSAGGVQILAERVDADSVDRLREMADQLRAKLGTVVVVLGAVIADKPMLVAAVTSDLVQQGLHAGKLVGQIARLMGGGGGGSPSMAQALVCAPTAQASGRDASRLEEALAQVPVKVEEALAHK
jgi:alanyl-tRNA synthetase